MIKQLNNKSIPFSIFVERSSDYWSVRGSVLSPIDDSVCQSVRNSIRRTIEKEI